ncbi:hypothetical protein HYH03_008385 [Edaphochlamys debaryana]|uniref:Aminotransferase class V domain-containing protein n=1 Tax=Edaphochlamys debaryana TaxID=47281 RepID=A0A835XY57_9CHLO|nr:hypothetical protein HYH03_008385 [Edaphochlamys debaryana]|eukprot:KAG2493247.1 hypothetical protein HYH03_008385 [Edaphochlamys debaryana]
MRAGGLQATSVLRGLTVAASFSTRGAQTAAVNAAAEVAGLGEALPHLTRSGCLYLDYNATTPILPEVANEMAPFLFEHFGNPSSGHTYGRTCKAAVDLARRRVATLVNAADPSEIHFTSCGTESDNWAIYGSTVAGRRRAAAVGGLAAAAAAVPHVVTSVVEHPAVLVHLNHLRDLGLLTYTAVPVDREGLVDPADVAAAVRPSTALVTIMHSNNEVGSLQPIARIATAARRAHAAAVAAASGGTAAPGERGWLLVHTDAAQSTGKVPLDVEALGVDLMTVVGHKFGAPKGVAALYIRRGVELPNYFYGGGQEGGRRAGTENVMQVVGLGAAAAIAVREDEALRSHVGDMAERLLRGVRGAVAAEDQDKVRVNGPTDPARRLPNTLSLSIRGLNSALALQQLSAQLAASAGAACHSSGASVSSVLRAMQVPSEYAAGTLRLSTGRHTTPEEVDRAVALIVGEARRQGVIS